MKITGQSAPLAEIRNANAGDWQYSSGEIAVAMAAGLSDDETLLLFVHELIEARLCQKASVTDEEVTAWDAAHLDADEPGEVGGAPYREQHARALEIERHLADILGVPWADYEQRLRDLFK